jgi:hypothetical protein
MRFSLLALLTCIAINLAGQSHIDNDTSYNFKARLLAPASPTPHCGIIAWAIVQKFEVISTDYPKYKNKYVVIIESCPEFLGKSFFKANHIYSIRASTNSGATFDFTYFNKYKTENVPTFWSRHTTKVD